MRSQYFNMRIYKYYHSCVLLEEKGDRILIDPGEYSFIEGKVKPEEITGLSGILITHEHQDHVDPISLKKILNVNKNAVVYSHRAVKNILAREGISVEAHDAGSFSIGSFHVEVILAHHEKILRSEPANIAFLINNIFLHTGDSRDPVMRAHRNLPLLALPIMAPWTRAIDAVEFAKNLSPKNVLPIHDGFAKDFFLEGQYKGFDAALAAVGIAFRPLKKHDEYIEI